MKYYNVYDEYNDKYTEWFVGESSEIKALAGSLRRHEIKCDKHNLMCGINRYFLDSPIIRPYRIYGLSIDEKGYWTVHNAETVVRDVFMINERSDF